jgi:rubredoxin
MIVIAEKQSTLHWRTRMSSTWKNDFIFTEFSCARCGGTEHKQIPKEWTDIYVTEYFENDYFCLACGMHGYFTTKSDKILA